MKQFIARRFTTEQRTIAKNKNDENTNSLKSETECFILLFPLEKPEYSNPRL